MITSQRTWVLPLPPSHEIDASAQRYRKALAGPQDVLASANRYGQALYRMLVAPAQALLTKGAKIFIIPDGSLNNLNFETLLAPGTDTTENTLHYWIEDATIVNANSLRMLAARAGRATSQGTRNRSLLLVGNSVAPNKKYPELPKAGAEMESVARHFPVAQRRIITREHATPAAYLASRPEQFSHVHFVAHGTASRLSPLDSAIVLSKTGAPQGAGSETFQALRARHHSASAARGDLVTISACYGAGRTRVLRRGAGRPLLGLP